MRVLGIDPGSRFTGYGLLELAGGGPKHVDNGVIVLSQKMPLAQRLAALSEAIDELVSRYAPTTAAVETVFAHKNVQSALVLAQARGAILAVLGKHNLPVSEYSPAEIKSSVAGHGRAEKPQMQKMVRLLLGLPEIAATDASDALAVGICHLRTARFQSRVLLAKGGA